MQEFNRTPAIKHVMQDFDKHTHLFETDGIKGLLLGAQRKLGTIYYKEPGFSLKNLDIILQNVSGDFIEFAGPTFKKFGLYIDYPFLFRLANQLKRHFYISNLHPGGNLNTWYPNAPNNKQYTDFCADITKMPLENDSLAMIIYSHLTSDVILKALEESFRTLSCGGLLMMQGVTMTIIAHAHQIGFKILYYEWDIGIGTKIATWIHGNSNLTIEQISDRLKQQFTNQENHGKGKFEDSYFSGPDFVIFQKPRNISPMKD